MFPRMFPYITWLTLRKICLSVERLPFTGLTVPLHVGRLLLRMKKFYSFIRLSDYLVYLLLGLKYSGQSSFLLYYLLKDEGPEVLETHRS